MHNDILLPLLLSVIVFVSSFYMEFYPNPSCDVLHFHFKSKIVYSFGSPKCFAMNHQPKSIHYTTVK